VAVTDSGTLTDMGKATAILVQTDNKIIVAGLRNFNTVLNFAVAKYNSDGTPDTTFDSDGLVSTDFGTTSSDQAFATAIQSDGKILVAGGSYSSKSSIAVARYNNIVSVPAGSIDINTPVEDETITAYPNPFAEQTVLQTNNPLYNATLVIYNCFGQQVKEIENISGPTVNLFRDNLPNGLYFVRLTQGNIIIAADKLVIIG